MQLFSRELELAALYLMCSSSKAGHKISSSLTLDYFCIPQVHSAAERFYVLCQQRGEHPSWAALVSDPILEDSTRNLLRKYKPDEREIAGSGIAEEIISGLNKWRQGRELKRLADSILDSFKGETFDPEVMLEESRDQLLKASTGISQAQSLFHTGKGANTSELIKEILYGTEIPLHPTGFQGFDSVNGGLVKSGLVIMAAYTSSLKSAMANQILSNMFKNGVNTVKVSLEMPALQEHQRLLSMVSGVPLSHFSQRKLTEDDRKKALSAYKKMSKAGRDSGVRQTFYCPLEDVSLTQVFMTLQPYQYDVILVDYITLLKGSDGENQWRELGRIAREAKIYSGKNNALVIMLAQLDEDNKIRYSRTIKEHADQVWQWAVSDSDRDNGAFTVKQVKGRDQQLISWEVQVDFSTLAITDASGGGAPSKLSEDDEDASLYNDNKSTARNFEYQPKDDVLE